MSQAANFEKHSHCSYCGYPYPRQDTWPRLCAHCKNVGYRNPLPVAVILVPVGGGLLTVRRNIQPRLGQLALPGGYIETGETWQEAGAREVYEETGVLIDPGAIRDCCVRSAPDETLLVFGIGPSLNEAIVENFNQTPEVSELNIVYEPTTLAFSLHTDVVKRYFELSY